MNGVLNFDLPNSHSNMIMAIGIGTEGAKVAHYLEEKGICDVDFLVTDQITPAKIERYRSAVFIMDNDPVNYEFASKLAALAKELNILMIGFLILDNSIEEIKKMNYSLKEIDGLENFCNSILLIPKIHLQSSDNKLSISDNLEANYQIVHLAFRTIFEISFSVVAWDFSDTYEATKNGGVAFFATGEASGNNRTVTALKNALSFNLNTIDFIGDANYIILHIISNENLLINEIEEIFDYLNKILYQEPNISWRVYFDNQMGENVRISIVGTGLDKPRNERNFDFEEFIFTD